MKTLQQIKDGVAKEHGTEWNELMSDRGGNPDDIQDYTDEVAKRYAEEVIKEAASKCIEDGNPISAKYYILDIVNELK